MTYQESIERYGLVPTDESLPAIRQLLAHEAELERSGYGEERKAELALLCCVQLFSRGIPEDALLIWEAKQSGFDLGLYLDIQHLCGNGLQQTKEFLRTHPSPEAASALEELLDCEAHGEFEGWSPSTHFEYWRRYFRELNNSSCTNASGQHRRSKALYYAATPLRSMARVNSALCCVYESGSVSKSYEKEPANGDQGNN
ncbi:MAG TPA: hypothetical protein VNA16_04335 [Abditibacteriaceae bacterium]|nr:hypothetical protein [Abditibacteriaceae bacterium]